MWPCSAGSITGRVAVSADVDGPVVGSDRGSSPGGGRGHHQGRLRLAAATLLKVSLEAVAKMVVQRDRPAETLPDVILRGQSAAHGLSCPSGHAMVIFAITALVAPYFKGW